MSNDREVNAPDTLLYDPRDDPRARVGTVLRGKWQLEALIGVGGSAAVYAASHKNNGARAAVKVLHTELGHRPDLVARFIKEGYFANKIGHRGAVSVLDDDRAEDGAVYMVMELLEGESLERWVGGDERLPLEQVVRVADEVLDLLAAAHAVGVIHRDIKPGNVFLTRDGGVKVLDFGIARFAEAPATSMSTQLGTQIGTPTFMPPEQARGRWNLVDGRSDVFGVGATLFALLTGHKPREAETANEELLLAMTTPMRSVSELRPDLPFALADAVDRALAFEMSARWPDARAMQAALRMARAVVDDEGPKTIATPSVVTAAGLPAKPAKPLKPTPIPPPPSSSRTDVTTALTAQVFVDPEPSTRPPPSDAAAASYHPPPLPARPVSATTMASPVPAPPDRTASPVPAPPGRTASPVPPPPPPRASSPGRTASPVPAPPGTFASPVPPPPRAPSPALRVSPPSMGAAAPASTMVSPVPAPPGISSLPRVSPPPMRAASPLGSMSPVPAPPGPPRHGSPPPMRAAPRHASAASPVPAPPGHDAPHLPPPPPARRSSRPPPARASSPPPRASSPSRPPPPPGRAATPVPAPPAAAAPSLTTTLPSPGARGNNRPMAPPPYVRAPASPVAASPALTDASPPPAPPRRGDPSPVAAPPPSQEEIVTPPVPVRGSVPGAPAHGAQANVARRPTPLDQVRAPGAPPFTGPASAITVTYDAQFGPLLVGVYAPADQPPRLRCYALQAQSIAWQALKGEARLTEACDLMILGREVYLGHRAELEAFDLVTGGQLWSSRLPDKMDAALDGTFLVEAGGGALPHVLLVRTTSGAAVSIDRATGQERARRNLGGGLELWAAEGGQAAVLRYRAGDRYLLEVVNPITLEPIGSMGKSLFGDGSTFLQASVEGTFIVARVEEWGLLGAKGLLVLDTASQREVLFLRESNVDPEVSPVFGRGVAYWATTGKTPMLQSAPGGRKVVPPYASHRILTLKHAGPAILVALEDMAQPGLTRLAACDPQTLAARFQGVTLAPPSVSSRHQRRDAARYALTHGQLVFAAVIREDGGGVELRAIDASTGGVVWRFPLHDVGPIDAWHMAGPALVVKSHGVILVIDPIRGVPVARYVAG